MKLFSGLSFREIRSTTTFRLAAILGGLFFLGVSLLGVLIYALTTQELTARSQQILDREVARLQTAPPDRLRAMVAAEVERNGQGLDRFSLLSADGRLIIGSIPPPPGLVLNRGVDIEANGALGPMRILAVRARDQNIILVGRDITEIRYLEHHILLSIIISCLLIVPAVLAIGVLISVPSLLRIQELQRVSRRVSSGEFALRLPQSSRGDELDRMALTVNVMIEDIGRIVDQVKNVTDAIAHDLRTPLTRVRSQLERMGRDGGDQEHARIEPIIDDLDSVLERFAALLRISEIEARKRRSGFETVSLNLLASDVVGLYRPVADDMLLTLTAVQEVKLEIPADRNLLFEALTNLVDNAIKHATSEISVSVSQEGSMAVLAVRDDGPGIPASERRAVVQRFYRHSGHDAVQGNGLGLSVVAAILNLHHFELELADAAPGLLARIVMPLPQ